MKTRTGNKKPNKRSFPLDKWLDEWKLALMGVGLACQKPKFLIVAGVTFLIFGTLMNLLTNGFASFQLMAAVDWGGKMDILGGAFLAIFGVGRSFLDWVLVFFISLLQGVLVGLVILNWHKKQKNKKAQKQSVEKPVDKSVQKTQVGSVANNAENVQTAGLAAGLAVLSAGCPTCGTTLLMPVLGAIGSTSGYAIAGAVSGAIFILAIVVALLALKKVGYDTYVIIKSEEYERRRHDRKKPHKSKQQKSEE